MRRLEQRGAVAFTAMGVAVVVILHVVILLITLWAICSRGRRAAYPVVRSTSAPSPSAAARTRPGKGSLLFQQSFGRGRVRKTGL